VELTDGVIRLRRFRKDDAPAVAVACDDPDTARFIPGMPSPYTVEDARAYVESCDRAWRTRERLPFAIVDDADRVLGAVDVKLGEVGSIGYWIGRAERGRGVATRALLLLSRWALHDGGVERLELTTHLENLASQRVAEKAGFVREGILRSHLRFAEGRRDSVLFSLLPSDVSGGA
jgi:[ribosomal protein S5]-alanine N-acetyltransferase